MQKHKKPSQTFNSGEVKVYEVENTSPPGRMPKLSLKSEPLCQLNYDERMVGYGRRMMGKQAGMSVDRLIRCPRRDDVTTKCVAVLHDGQRYRIHQVQYPPEPYPLVMDVSLGRMEPDEAL